MSDRPDQDQAARPDQTNGEDPPDYDQLLDAPTRAFIARTNSFWPDEDAPLSLSAQRRIYDRMCLAFNQTRSDAPRGQDLTTGGIACRYYRPLSAGQAARILYVHGGGFMLGGLGSHDAIVADLAAGAGLEAIAVDYRLSPEAQHPAALNDVLAVIRALPGPLVLVGDSAGANLVAAAAHILREPRLLGQVLIYPALGRDTGQGSYIRHAFAPLLSRADMAFYAGIRHGGTVPAPGDATATPLDDRDFTRLPLTLALAAECDPLADDALIYAQKIRAQGGKAVALTDQGLVHGWLRARHEVPRAAAAFARICETVSQFARHEWRFDEGAGGAGQ